MVLNPNARQFLESLLSTPGVSGYEQPVQRVVKEYVEAFADRVEVDFHGNLIATCQPDAPVRVMLAGHCDQIGLIVSHVDENGFLFVQTVGGWDPYQLVGQAMVVWTKDGPLPGVIARKPIHLLEENERKQVVKSKDLWIDIGARGQEQALEKVRIGDAVTFEMGMRELQNERIAGPAMDNRTGVWVVMEALRRAKEKGCRCALSSVSTVQEEIGLRGARTAAFAVDPHIGIAVDVTHATDCPTVDSRQNGDIKLGGGPVVVRGPNVNPIVWEKLLAVGAAKEIPCQAAALGRAAPNDSNVLQVTRGGVATGLISIPNRYMHSAVETVSLTDLDQSAELLAEFICQIENADDFIPV